MKIILMRINFINNQSELFYLKKLLIILKIVENKVSKVGWEKNNNKMCKRIIKIIKKGEKSWKFALLSIAKKKQWEDGCIGGWMVGLKAVLRIAYSNKNKQWRTRQTVHTLNKMQEEDYLIYEY